MGIHIESIGVFFPETKISAQKISEWSKVPVEVLEEKIGFEEVPHTDEKYSTSQMGFLAAREALTNAGVKPSDLGLIINAHATPQDDFWYAAPTIHGMLGATKAQVFDVSCGCASFTIALNLAAKMMVLEEIDYAIVVSAESFSRHVDYSNPELLSFFHASDGAGAMILKKEGTGPELKGFHQITDGSMAASIRHPTMHSKGGSPYIQVADPSKLEKVLGEVYLSSYKEVIEESLAKSGYTLENLDYLVTNQVKESTSNAISKCLGVSSDRYIRTMKKFGHVGAVDSPLGLMKTLEVAKQGDVITLAASAAGFSWAAITLVA